MNTFKKLRKTLVLEALETRQALSVMMPAQDSILACVDGDLHVHPENLWDPPLAESAAVVESGPTPPEILWDPPFGEPAGLVNSGPGTPEIL